MSSPFDWRCQLKIRTRDVSRIFNNVTHPTDLGASNMRMPVTGKRFVPPELLLLLEVFQEECAAEITVRVPDQSNPSVLLPVVAKEDLEERPVPNRTHLNPRGSMVIDFDRLPPPPPPMVCEFDLGLSSRGYAAGQFLNVIFWMMIFSMEGIRRVMPRRYDGQEVGSDLEASGVWGVATRRERPAKATARDIRKRRAGGAPA